VVAAGLGPPTARVWNNSGEISDADDNAAREGAERLDNPPLPGLHVVVDSATSMYGEWTTVTGGPRAVLDVLIAGNDQACPRLPNR
jgi:hypothetical protein